MNILIRQTSHGQQRYKRQLRCAKQLATVNIKHDAYCRL